MTRADGQGTDSTNALPIPLDAPEIPIAAFGRNRMSEVTVGWS
jgi:hypothetical protein